jgi:hypothetical protein
MKYFLFLSFLIFSINCFPQEDQRGINIGGALFKGDINRNFAFIETKPSVGIIYREHISYKLALRYNFIFTTLTGSDKRNESYSNEDIRYKLRNLHFRSRVYDFTITFEYYLKNLKNKKTHLTSLQELGCFILTIRQNIRENGITCNL